MFSAHPPSKRTILCIDDDVAILRYENVLLDYEMPGMNGNEVASEIKRIRPNLSIILLSGSEVPTYALALVDAFVPKLEASRELLPMIAELCSRPHDPQQKQERLHDDGQ